MAFSLTHAAVISIGAAAGALLRWQLSVRLNHIFPNLPLGTLLSNILGGYIVGVAVGWIIQSNNLSPELRLLVITGFCGGLTTFSTFSVEVIAAMQSGRLATALSLVGLHLFGSLAATYLGLLTVRA